MDTVQKPYTYRDYDNFSNTGTERRHVADFIALHAVKGIVRFSRDGSGFVLFCFFFQGGCVSGKPWEAGTGIYQRSLVLQNEEQLTLPGNRHMTVETQLLPIDETEKVCATFSSTYNQRYKPQRHTSSGLRYGYQAKQSQ